MKIYFQKWPVIFEIFANSHLKITHYTVSSYKFNISILTSNGYFMTFGQFYSKVIIFTFVSTLLHVHCLWQIAREQQKLLYYEWFIILFVHSFSTHWLVWTGLLFWTPFCRPCDVMVVEMGPWGGTYWVASAWNCSYWQRHLLVACTGSSNY